MVPNVVGVSSKSVRLSGTSSGILSSSVLTEADSFDLSTELSATLRGMFEPFPSIVESVATVFKFTIKIINQNLI